MFCMSSSIGSRIRDLRVAKGLTQMAIAGPGISAGYVSLVESGKRTPSADMVARFAERLGVPVAELDVDSVELHRPERRTRRGQLRATGAGQRQPRRGAALHRRVVPRPRWTARRPATPSWCSHRASSSSVTWTARWRPSSCCWRAAASEEAWLTLCVAATTLTVMYLEFGDVSRAVDTASAALDDVEACGLGGTDEHLRLGATLVAAPFERGDLLYATHRIERLIRVADRVGSARARGSIYWNAATVAHGRGRIDDSIRLTDRAIALLGEQQDEPRPAPAPQAVRLLAAQPRHPDARGGPGPAGPRRERPRALR